MKCYFCVIVLRRPPCVEVKLPTTRTRNVMSSNSSSILVELYFVSIAYPYSEWKCWVGVIDADVAVVYSKVGRECIKTRDDVSMTKSSGARFSETRFLLGFSVSDVPTEEGIASSAPLLAARLRSFMTAWFKWYPWTMSARLHTLPRVKCVSMARRRLSVL